MNTLHPTPPGRASSRIPSRLLPALLCVAASYPFAESLASEVLGVLPDSGESMGMVGGHLANLSDPSTVRRSPANLLSLERPEVLVNLSAWLGDVKFSPSVGDPVRIEDPWKHLASFYYAHPIVPRKLAFGLALSAPFGLDSAWPRDRDSALHYLVPYEALLLTVDLNPVLAWRVTEGVTAALGLNLMYSRVTLKQYYPWSGLVPGSRDGVFDFDADGFGFSAFAGLRWDITPHQRLTVTGRLPIRVTYDGDFSASRMPAAVEALGFEKHSDFETDATFPGSIAVGYGLDIGRLTVGVDFQYTWNSSHDDVPLRIGKNQPLLGAEGLMLDWKDSIDIGVGLSYRLSPAWTLRAGYLFSEWAQRSQFHTPAIPGSDRHLISVGIGWRTERHRIDAAYAYAHFMDHDITDNVQPGFNGHYDVSWDIFTLSYGFRF